MRKVVAGLLMSLDGVVESPNTWGWAQYMNEEMMRGIVNGVALADAVLLGRVTYLDFAKLWPKQGSEVPMADFLNKSQKYVVSTTLEELEWGPGKVLKGDLGKELAALKSQPGKNILIPGSPTLVRSLLRHGLLDELNLNICPVVVGHGMRLFDEDPHEVRLKVVQSIALSTGVIGVTYQPVRDGAATPRPADFPEMARPQS